MQQLVEDVPLATDSRYPSVAGHDPRATGREGDMPKAVLCSSRATEVHLARSDDYQEVSTDTEPSPGCLDNLTPSENADIYEDEVVKPDVNVSMTEKQPILSSTDPPDDVHIQGLCLCHDIILEHPFASACMPTPPASAGGDLHDWPGMTEPQKATVVSLIENGERWDVDKESAGFLASIVAFGKVDAQPLSFKDSSLTFSDLKMDEPILQCDPGLEIQKLRSRNAVTLTTRGLQPFAVDVEQGESAKWPSEDLLLPVEKDREVSSEKLEVSKDAMAFLRDVAQPSPMSDAEMVGCFIQADKPKILEPQTPPLLPLSPPFSPPTLSAELMELPLTSTPEDLMAIEAAELQRTIMAADESSATAPDTIARTGDVATVDTPSLYSSLRTPTDSSSSPTHLTRLEDLKADVPVMPVSTPQSSPTKTKIVSFPRDMHSLIPLPESDMSILDPNVANQDLEAFAKDVMMPLAESVIAQVENEQLIEIDTTMRAPVPKLDSAAPAPPWMQYSEPGTTKSGLESQRVLLTFTKREMLNDETSWSGVSKLERTLGWSPFPARLGKVVVNEEFDDDGSSARYMASLAVDEDAGVGSLISMTEGLRILDGHESDNDDIEPVEFGNDEDNEDDVPAEVEQTSSKLLSSPPPRMPVSMQQTKPAKPKETAQPPRVDMQSLLRKRKQELEEAGRLTVVSSTPAESVPPLEKATKRARLTETALKPPRVSELLKQGSIAGFMHLHGNDTGARLQSNERISVQTQPAAPPAVMGPSPSADIREHYPRPPLPVPMLLNPERSIQAVVSTKLLADRALIRRLQKLLSGLELIERAPVRLGAPGRKGSVDSSENLEADITLSPAAGLLTTTLQKLKQKPLPGQNSFFGVRERIAAVSLRHEKLIVLVSQAQQLAGEDGIALQKLDERDCEALCGLLVFTTSLDADVEVYVVPGGEDEMVKWIAAAISQHAMVMGEDMRLLQDETLWEHLLRTAGLNAFAAQVILGQLKLPGLTPSEGSSSTIRDTESQDFGLAALVNLSPEQRLQRFGPLLGGDRVVRRVSEVIDGAWISAVSAATTA